MRFSLEVQLLKAIPELRAEAQDDPVALLLQLGVVALRGLERVVPLLRLLPRRVALTLDGLHLLLEAALVVASLRDADLGFRQQ